MKKEDIEKEALKRYPDIQREKECNIFIEGATFAIQGQTDGKKEELIPTQIRQGDVNIVELRRACKSYIDFINSNDYDDDDHQYYIFEEAMKALYGDNIFDWVNKNINK